MRRLLETVIPLIYAVTFLGILFITSMSFAWDLSWNSVPNADGYEVSYGIMPDATTPPPSFTQQDVGIHTTLNLDAWTIGERYEVYVQAYAGSPRSFSGHSDHLRWTVPSPPQIIEMLGAPVSIVINP